MLFPIRRIRIFILNLVSLIFLLSVSAELSAKKNPQLASLPELGSYKKIALILRDSENLVVFFHMLKKQAWTAGISGGIGGAIGGAIAGGIAANPESEAAKKDLAKQNKARQALKEANWDLATIFSDHFIRQTQTKKIPIYRVGEGKKGFKSVEQNFYDNGAKYYSKIFPARDYRALSKEGYDLVLEIQMKPMLSTMNAFGKKPNMVLHTTIRAIDLSQNKVLFSRNSVKWDKKSKADWEGVFANQGEIMRVSFNELSEILSGKLVKKLGL